MTSIVKTAVRSLIGALLIAGLAACSSSPPKPEVDFKQDYDFSHVRKIAMYPSSGGVSGDNPLQLSDMQRNRVDSALKLALENKSMTLVSDPAEADLLLSWHLATQHKTDVRTYQTPSYGGYYGGYNRYSMYNCWNCSPYRTEVSVQDYTEGTFIVDMIDPNLKQSVWRGITQSRLKGNQEYDPQKYNEAAAAMFFSFPPW